MESAQVDVFAGVENEVPGSLADHLRAIRLLDHHVHGYFTSPLDRPAFEDALNEGSTTPMPPHISMFQSPLGLAIRRWCAPLLGLAPHASADDYFSARTAIGDEAVARTLLTAAGVDTWIVDTGFAGDTIAAPDALARAGGGRAAEIVRLETLLESLLVGGVDPVDLAEAFGAALDALPAHVVGTKTVAAYRCGFDIDWARPSESEVVHAAQAVDVTGGRCRIESPALIAYAVHQALDRGLPLQVHVGYGDRDLDLHRAHPLQLLPLLRVAPAQVPITLLHCYPYHREAGYLAQAFEQVHLDVGLGINFLGAGSPRLIAESLELAPFAAHLYSSDAFGLPELHVLGSILWRRGMGLALGEWVRRGDCAESDAIEVVDLIARENAARVYRL